MRLSLVWMIVIGLSGCINGLPAEPTPSNPTVALPSKQFLVEQPTWSPSPVAATASASAKMAASKPPLKVIKPENPRVFLETVKLVIGKSRPLQVSVFISGSLPTPCSQLHTDVAEPDAERNIFVSVYSVSDPDKVCVQIIQEFQSSVELKMTGKSAGNYTLWVNGEKIGNFDWQ
jgi:hypothetical protein